MLFYSDYKQQIVMVDPDPSFEHYNPNLLEYEVRGFIDKINMLNGHSKEELQLAKRRAGA